MILQVRNPISCKIFDFLFQISPSLHPAFFPFQLSDTFPVLLPLNVPGHVVNFQTFSEDIQWITPQEFFDGVGDEL